MKMSEAGSTKTLFRKVDEQTFEKDPSLEKSPQTGESSETLFQDSLLTRLFDCHDCLPRSTKNLTKFVPGIDQ